MNKRPFWKRALFAVLLPVSLYGVFIAWFLITEEVDSMELGYLLLFSGLFLIFYLIAGVPFVLLIVWLQLTFITTLLIGVAAAGWFILVYAAAWVLIELESGDLLKEIIPKFIEQIATLVGSPISLLLLSSLAIGLTLVTKCLFSPRHA